MCNSFSMRVFRRDYSVSADYWGGFAYLNDMSTELNIWEIEPSLSVEELAEGFGVLEATARDWRSHRTGSVGYCFGKHAQFAVWMCACGSKPGESDRHPSSTKGR